MFYALIAPVVLAFTFDGLIHVPSRARRLRYATAVLQDEIPLAEVMVDLCAAQREREEQLNLRDTPLLHKLRSDGGETPHAEAVVEVDIEDGAPLHFPTRNGSTGRQKRGSTAREETPEPHPQQPNATSPTLKPTVSESGRRGDTSSSWSRRHQSGGVQQQHPQALLPTRGTTRPAGALTSTGSRSGAGSTQNTLVMDDRDGFFALHSHREPADLNLPPLHKSCARLPAGKCCPAPLPQVALHLYAVIVHVLRRRSNTSRDPTAGTNRKQDRHG
jgi:hypothetical protein